MKKLCAFIYATTGKNWETVDKTGLRSRLWMIQQYLKRH